MLEKSTVENIKRVTELLNSTSLDVAVIMLCDEWLALHETRKTEPCDWCKSKGATIKTWASVEYDFDDREYSVRGMEWQENKPNYCPSCGRLLESEGE